MGLFNFSKKKKSDSKDMSIKTNIMTIREKIQI